MPGYDEAGYWKSRAEHAEDLLKGYRKHIEAADAAMQLILALQTALAAFAPKAAS